MLTQHMLCIDSSCVCIYILYIYITPMLSIGVELAQTQLVQPDRTNRPSLTHTNPTTIYPSCAPILGFRPFCSTTVAVETVLSLSLVARILPPDHPTERVDVRPLGSSPPYSTLSLRCSSSSSPIRSTPPSTCASTSDLTGSRVPDFPPRR
jgi:hypothetical protein